MEKSNYLKFAIETALEAGDKILMRNYGKMQELDWNAKQHFRIEVDRMSDELIRRRIKENFPKHNIYSEENEGVNQSSEFSWVVDPLDGTIPYRYGITDHFSVCISLLKGKTPIVGVIYAPKRGELYHAEQRKGAFCNDQLILVSLEEKVNRVIMGLDGGKETEKFRRANLTKYIEKVYSPEGITCFTASGCASVPLCLAASGKLHAYIALSLEPWDMAAAVIINREASGKVTNLNGEEWNINDESIVTANPRLHRKLLDLLNG